MIYSIEIKLIYGYKTSNGVKNASARVPEVSLG